ncbi:hypothetical protein O0544_00640 [Edwardsiella anguillarum]|nr:hypothetical protein [Edwardsiella anguillarum]
MISPQGDIGDAGAGAAGRLPPGPKRRRPGDNNGDSPIDQDKGAPDERHARGVADAE